MYFLVDARKSLVYGGGCLLCLMRRVLFLVIVHDSATDGMASRRGFRGSVAVCCSSPLVLAALLTFYGGVFSRFSLRCSNGFACRTWDRYVV